MFLHEFVEYANAQFALSPNTVLNMFRVWEIGDSLSIQEESNGVVCKIGMCGGSV